MKTLYPICALWIIFSLSGCRSDNDGTATREKVDTSRTQNEETLFSVVDQAHSQIDFTNHFEENEKQNYYNYEYLYNGGGVAVGDINNDGLVDLYFTGNLVEDKLYLNKGDMQFEDITATAITSGQKGWHSGVTMADVNSDGHVDIYVCRAGWYKDPRSRTNLLYINNGDLTFTEQAKEYGVADPTRSTQGAFLDYDRDGDLDLYVINSPLQGGDVLNNVEVERLIAQHKSPTDRLYRNDGTSFTDVTAEKGIWNMGYGLGLSVSDLDDNGYPDLYVSNDYIERDQYYRNDQGDFTEDALKSMRHISNFGMGCDAADINNDGFVDLLTVDMVSQDHIRSKKNMSGMSRKKFWEATNAGYHLQFMFNAMQLNNGNGSFSEIANMSGISKTDWSWAPLFADFDNDGFKDLLVTNGFKRDMRDNDYMRKADELKKKNNGKVDFNEVLSLIPVNKVRNYLYRNNGDLTFTDMSKKWGFDRSINSNGAAYADLDLDGDLDLVINNMDVVSEIYENTTNSSTDHHFIQLSLQAPHTAESQGAKVTLETAGGIQFQELISSRGYQSSVEPIVHFGLGTNTSIDRLTVDWPNGQRSEYTDLAVDQRHELDRSDAVDHSRDSESTASLFSESRSKTPFMHKENTYDDFEIEVLLPHKLSGLGPHLSKGDVNGDGLDDVYVGGARDQEGRLLIAKGAGFVVSTSRPWQAHAASEDLGSVFFDADGDGDVDLYVVSGSNEVTMPFELYSDRLYMNDGKGNFTNASEGLPPMQTSAERAAAADIDGDGDLDLFVGGRGIPGQYPKAPRSYLLENDGNGNFTDISAASPELSEPGLVTDMLFTDHDGDGDDDLIVVGEWMPLTVFDNTPNGLVKKEMPEFENTEGWWYSLSAGDIDGDGDEDLIAGNIGMNNKFHPKMEKPLHVYWNDFDGNGRGDIVLAKGDEDHLLPVRGRECSSEQCPVILEKFPSYDAFANASLEEVYGEDKLDNSLKLSAKDFHSYLLINDGNGHYTKRKLPNIAQISPINGSAFADVNDDGNLDVIIAGNMWGAEVETVRYDAGNGLVMLGDGKGGLDPLSVGESGLFAPLDAKDLLVIQDKGELKIIIANNNGPLQVFERNGRTLLSQRGK